MPKDIIRYDLIVQDAMLDVVKKVLQDTEKNGLRGDHHFYLTYSTRFAGVEMPGHLLEKYPDEITIVLQHEFEGLKVLDDSFAITLWFNNVPAHLVIPYKAIKAFFDPSVKFGLQFNPVQEIDEDAPAAEVVEVHKETPKKKKGGSKKEISEASQEKTDTPAGANVISLDAFRKK